jgi:hypothetical protein
MMMEVLTEPGFFRRPDQGLSYPVVRFAGFRIQA